MYSFEQVVDGLRNPGKVVHELRTEVARPAYLTTVARWNGHRAVDVMAEDWDVLVILDACRYDLFEAVSDLPGDLSKVVSPGTGTDEFLDRTVAGREFPGVVYLTANPHLHFVDARFHDVVRLWESDWDDDLDTVPPGPAVDRTLAAAERHPDKRLVAHLVQPHYPFIGGTGRELEARNLDLRGFLEDTDSVFHHLRRGTLDRDVVRRAYRENLEVALPHVRRLVEAVDGRVVVTSDHGNAFGEWGVYGHGGPKIPALVDVPWLVVEGDDRPTIHPGEETVSSLDLAAVEGDGVVEQRLADLGYT